MPLCQLPNTVEPQMSDSSGVIAFSSNGYTQKTEIKLSFSASHVVTERSASRTIKENVNWYN